MKKLFYSFWILILFSTNIAFSEQTMSKEELQNQILEKIMDKDAISAEKLSNEYIKKYPNSSYGYLTKGIATTDSQKAISYLTIAIAIDNTNDTLLTLAKLTRARVYFNQGNDQDAYNDCKNISEIDIENLPSDLQYLYFSLRTYLEIIYKKDYYAGIAYANKGLKIKESAELYSYRGTAFKRIGDEKKSMYDAIKVATICKNDNNSNSTLCKMINEF